MSDDLIDAMKNYSCKYCKKHFSRSINCRYHELHCKPRKPGDVSYRHDFQFGTGTERNGDLKKFFKDLIILLLFTGNNWPMTATWAT